MKKILFTGSFIFAFLLILTLMIFGKKTVYSPPLNFSPTPTPVAIQNVFSEKNSFSLIKTAPYNKEKNVPLNTPISLSFNKAVGDTKIDFSIVPNISYTIATHGASLTITPQESFLPNTTYIYFITISGLPTYTASFTTKIDPSVTVPPDFANNIENEINKHNYPDAFLAGNTPYTTNDFSVFSTYVDSTNTFSFTVTYYSDKQIAEKEFFDWATSLGLTTKQVATLQVTYQQPIPGF